MSRRVEMLSLIAPALLTLFALAASAQQVPDGKLQSANLGRCTLDSGKWIDPCVVTYRTFAGSMRTATTRCCFPVGTTGAARILPGSSDQTSW